MKAATFILLLVSLASCDSESTEEYLPPGDIVGRVQVLDTMYRELDPSGVTVRIEGTPHKCLSDSTGSWVLKDVPMGSYTLILEKSGFSFRKIFNFLHTGNGVLYYESVPRLIQIATLDVELILRSFEVAPGFPDSTLVAHFTINQHSELYSGLAARVFLSKTDSLINPLNPNSYDRDIYAYLLDSNGFHANIIRDSLLEWGYTPGMKIYARAGISNDTYYYDRESRKYIYTGYGKNISKTKSFLLP